MRTDKSCEKAGNLRKKDTLAMGLTKDSMGSSVAEISFDIKKKNESCDCQKTVNE